MYLSRAVCLFSVLASTNVCVYWLPYLSWSQKAMTLCAGNPIPQFDQLSKSYPLWSDAGKARHPACVLPAHNTLPVVSCSWSNEQLHTVLHCTTSLSWIRLHVTLCGH